MKDRDLALFLRWSSHYLMLCSSKYECSLQKYDFLSYDFLTTGNLSQIADKIADIIVSTRQLYDDRTTALGPVQCSSKNVENFARRWGNFFLGNRGC